MSDEVDVVAGQATETGQANGGRLAVELHPACLFIARARDQVWALWPVWEHRRMTTFVEGAQSGLVGMNESYSRRRINVVGTIGKDRHVSFDFSLG